MFLVFTNLTPISGPGDYYISPIASGGYANIDDVTFLVRPPFRVTGISALVTGAKAQEGEEEPDYSCARMEVFLMADPASTERGTVRHRILLSKYRKSDELKPWTRAPGFEPYSELLNLEIASVGVGREGRSGFVNLYLVVKLRDSDALTIPERNFRLTLKLETA